MLGPHDPQDQYDGLYNAYPCLDHEFVFIVDDWNWEKVRRGTMNAITDIGLVVVKSIEVRTSDDDSHPEINGKNSDWHNGYFLAILRKF